MLKLNTGKERPLKLKINSDEYIYDLNDSEIKENFFKKLKKYENFKIEVILMDEAQRELSRKNYIIRDVRENINGVAELNLD